MWPRYDSRGPARRGCAGTSPGDSIVRTLRTITSGRASARKPPTATSPECIRTVTRFRALGMHDRLLCGDCVEDTSRCQAISATHFENTGNAREQPAATTPTGSDGAPTAGRPPSRTTACLMGSTTSWQPAEKPAQARSPPAAPPGASSTSTRRASDTATPLAESEVC